MIAIVNVNKTHDPLGVNDYELRINEKVIATFKHNRTEGLAECLKKAAAAADKAKWEKLASDIERLSCAEK